ncbi:hypothetical protein DFH06DRAFT_1159083 [Mycena polygramma]|nr:hypothetical protein DFH06DRAFT_1159083 [Mycena polygramma]
MTRILALSLAVAALSYVAADSETSVIVPFADPQPISADILGVDAQGRTTWQLHQGAFTGTWTDPQGSFPGTATLVEGADYASYTYSVAAPEGTFVLGGVCSLNAGVQICVDVVDASDAGGLVTATQTQTAVPFGLEIGAGATGAPSAGSGGSSAAPSGKPNGSSSPAASAPSSTSTGASSRTTASGIAALAGLLIASYHLV